MASCEREAAAHLEPPERRLVRTEQEGEVRDLLAAVAAVQVDDVAAAARLERARHAAPPVAAEQREMAAVLATLKEELAMLPPGSAHYREVDGTVRRAAQGR